MKPDRCANSKRPNAKIFREKITGTTADQPTFAGPEQVLAYVARYTHDSDWAAKANGLDPEAYDSLHHQLLALVKME